MHTTVCEDNAKEQQDGVFCHLTSLLGHVLKLYIRIFQVSKSITKSYFSVTFDLEFPPI
jgi:hypothetical protein